MLHPTPLIVLLLILGSLLFGQHDVTAATERFDAIAAENPKDTESGPIVGIW